MCGSSPSADIFWIQSIARTRNIIREQIREQLSGTSVTVVLIGKNTSESDWVADEVKWSLEKGNGVLGIRLERAATIPPLLSECGAEVVPWHPQSFQAAIERAAKWPHKMKAILAADSASDSCRR